MGMKEKASCCLEGGSANLNSCPTVNGSVLEDDIIWCCHVMNDMQGLIWIMNPSQILLRNELFTLYSPGSLFKS